MSTCTMFVKVIGLIFLFIIRLLFLKSYSIPDIIRKRYGDKVLKDVRKLEKTDLKLRKCQLDLDFLNLCRDNNVIPNFLNFRMANKNL